MYNVSLHLQSSHPTDIKDQWNRLASACKSPGAVYQSPSYSEYLAKTMPARRVDLIILSNDNDSHTLGFVPIQHFYVLLPWSSRATTLGGIKLKSINLLGSEPNIPETSRAFDEVFSLINVSYKSAQVISMESIPADSFTWRYVSTSKYISENYFVYVLHGFRDCHIVNIPASLEAYHASLTRKKRYNLSRQKRLLENHLGQKLSLIAIDSVTDLHQLFSALKELKVPTTHESTLSESEFKFASEYGFTLCYILKCGEQTVGMAIGTKSNSIYKIHRFYYDNSLKKYSVGTTLWQEILCDIITRGSFSKVDMGYGAPTYQYHLTNHIEKRGNVLLVRRSNLNRTLLHFYSLYRNLLLLIKQRLTA
jgi:CelD/BcsL family acetyltransferase involved in cellulose biosynthesis